MADLDKGRVGVRVWVLISHMRQRRDVMGIPGGCSPPAQGPGEGGGCRAPPASSCRPQVAPWPRRHRLGREDEEEAEVEETETEEEGLRRRAPRAARPTPPPLLASGG